MSDLLAQVIRELITYPKEKEEEYAEELRELFDRDARQMELGKRALTDKIFYM